MPSCPACGKECKEQMGLKGHVRMTDDPDGPHGPQGEIPDGLLETSGNASTRGETSSGEKPWYTKTPGELIKGLLG